ncbi:hypothetical protein PSEUBRA_003522 [Kalmanozyma brasiliensis GHG001]|uniref:Ubiquinone biosynthesis protein n=1 Tax=Kalmanozyma brasiliensis (strain GHG001) TaxID=1365824 RepID=V5EPQ4_KALBG|nr:uncharacterized protein PSEUBRA_003522 [Kalmanozyma brasiliensis GHG001]EST07065.1 hypothetical protein PSEUBRA_003522 [Kalmanozyma brasiliensis GHG001]
MSVRSALRAMHTVARVAGPSRAAIPARSAIQPRLRSRQSSRSIASSSRTSESPSASSSQTPIGSSSSSSPHHTTHSAPDASTLLLLDSIPHIPQYGFTRQAYLRTSADPLDTDELSKRMRVVSTLFPGPESSFDAKLFEAWNSLCDLSVIHGVSPETVLASLRTGEEAGKTQGKPVNTRKNLSKAEERAAIEKVAAVIEERLRLSWSVRGHLTQGITSLSTLSPTSSTLHSVFPHQTVLPNLPTPLPLLNLTSGFISTVLTHPTVQARTGYIDPDGPDWYSLRTRLTLAYTAATLHAASPSIAHFQDTQRLFRRAVEGRETGLAATLGGIAGNAGEWVRWGGRGWLGVLRSLGL